MRVAALLILFLNFNSVFSQTPLDTFVLKDFSFIQKSVSSKSQYFRLNDFVYSNFSDALKSQSALNIREYGLGALSGVSIRGLSTQHTNINWNGCNIQNSMNGTCDLNLLPMFLLNNYILSTSQNEHINSTGNIGGSLNLNNTKSAEFFRVLSSVGSFSNRELGIKLTKNINSKMQYQVAFWKKYALNNFEFENYFKAQKPIQRQENNQISQNAFTHNFYYDLKKHQFQFSQWYMLSERQLPPAMGSSNNYELQSDENFRNILKHSFKTKLNSNLNLQNENFVSFSIDKLEYQSLVVPVNNYNFKQLQAQSKFLFDFKECLKFSQTIDYSMQMASTENYHSTQNRQILSLFSHIEIDKFKNKLIFNLSNQMLINPQQNQFFLPNFKIIYKPIKNLLLTYNVSKTFRLPTMNDLYWIGSGNSNLKPENGLKNEISLKFMFKKFYFYSNIFNYQVENWIQWTPNSNNNLWSPINLKTVNSKGIEFGYNFNKLLKKLYFKVDGKMQFVESINQSSNISNNIYWVNKTLPYTPNFNMVQNINIYYKKFSFLTNFHGQSFMYVTADNHASQIIEGFYNINQSINYKFELKKHFFDIGFCVKNFTNQKYQLMLNRPMPLRNYQLNINYIIK